MVRTIIRIRTNIIKGLFLYLKKVNFVKITSNKFGNWTNTKYIGRKAGTVTKNIIRTLLNIRNNIKGNRL